MSTSRIPGGLLLAGAFLVAALGPTAAPPIHAQSACSGAPFAALDFLVGDWRLVGDRDAELGRSTWRREAGGCLLVEEVRGGGGLEVHGMLYRDPGSGDWYGSWVDSRGDVARLRGEAVDGRAVLMGESSALPAGTVARVTFERGVDAAGGARQLLEASSDGGATWRTVSESRYLPLGAPAPAPTEPTPTRRRERARAPEPEIPAPEAPAAPAPASADPRPAIERSPREADRPAPPSGSLAVLSAQSEDAPQDPIRMASPMQLQLPIGPVENLPEGYGWSSTDTAPYTAEEVSIRRVEVKQRRRGGRIELHVTLGVHAATFVERADLQVELLDAGGAVVEAQDRAKVSVGRGIPEQSDQGVVSELFRFTLDRESFETLFSGGQRPQLRLTVTVRD